MSLIGQVLYYVVPSGRRLRSIDHGVTAEYAIRVSKTWPKDLVEWSCQDNPNDVRYYLAGRQVTPSSLIPSWSQTRISVDE